MTLPRQTDRAFGLTMAGALAVLAGIVWYASGQRPTILPSIAVGFLVVALAAPGLLLPLNRLWWAFAMRLSRVSNLLILGIFFFLVVVPTGLIIRLAGRDPLRRSRGPEAKSYWSPVERQTDANTLADMF